MRRRRRWEGEELEDRRRPATPQLARLDEGKRAGVLEELQRAGGNNAVQRVVGAQLQRDTTTEEKPTKRGLSFAAGTWLLSMDGTIVGAVPSVSGCGARAQVVVEPMGPTGVTKKHTAGIEYEPCVLEVGLGLGKTVFDWIGDTTAKKDVRKNLTLHQVDASGNERAQLEISQAMLTKVQLPRLAADDTSAAFLTVTIDPQAVTRRAGSGHKLDAKPTSDPLVPSTVRFEVSGIGQLAGLKSVEPWLFEQKVQEDLVGTVKQKERFRSTQALGDLAVTLSESGKSSKSGVAGFDAWFEEFAVKGNSRDERTATLTVSSKSGRTLRLEFAGVGIVAAEQIGRADGGRRYELYVESVKLSAP